VIAVEEVMPSPIGHTLAGCAVALALIPPGIPQAWEAWACCLISANLADVDFIPGLLTGNPRAFHRGASHTIVAAFIMAAIGASLWTWSAMPWLVRAGIIFVAYASHVGLDYLTPGRGLLMGWPLSRRRYQAERPWFLSVTITKTRHHVKMRGEHWQNLRAIRREILLMSPVVIILALASKLS
jgi:membrane-bound metal-dependent hydrolase YbcI (DUF457 family)